MTTRWPLLLLVGLLATAAAIALSWGCWGRSVITWPRIKARIHHEFPEVRQISVTDLAEQLDATSAKEGRGPTARRPVLLDVRTPEEYAVSHLPGASRLDPQAEGERLEGELPPGLTPDTPIVVYCSVGYRSSRLATRLLALGYRDVSNLEGSIFEWANTGHDVVRGGVVGSDVVVHQVHPYDRLWGSLLDRPLWAWKPGSSDPQPK